jgi:hypothetical protein
MEGTGEKPTLIQGYENCALCSACENLTTPAMLVLLDICDIVGNEEPYMLETDDVGNDTDDSSKSLLKPKSCSKLDSDLF